MLERRTGFLSQRAGISKVSTRFNSIGTYPPIPFLQSDNPGQLRERVKILVAFSIFKIPSGQTQKNVYQRYPDFTTVCFREFKIKLKTGLAQQIFLPLPERRQKLEKKDLWKDKVSLSIL